MEHARRNAAETGVADRVRFEVADAGRLGEAQYDVVTAFECVHDLPDPVAVLTAMRAMVRPGGTVLVVDERVAETFTAPGTTSSASVRLQPDLLPARLAVDRGLSGTGTAMRPSTLAGYAADAGFTGVEVLPVEHDFFRFYRLVLP